MLPEMLTVMPGAPWPCASLTAKVTCVADAGIVNGTVAGLTVTVGSVTVKSETVKLAQVVTMYRRTVPAPSRQGLSYAEIVSALPPAQPMQPVGELRQTSAVCSPQLSERPEAVRCHVLSVLKSCVTSVRGSVAVT